MRIRTEIESALRELESSTAPLPDGIPEKFTWKNVLIPCICTSFAELILIDAEGNPITIDARIIVRASHFLTVDTDQVTVDGDVLLADNDTPVPASPVLDPIDGVPVTGRLITFRGRTLKILNKKLSPCKSHWTFDLADPGSNR